MESWLILLDVGGTISEMRPTELEKLIQILGHLNFKTAVVTTSMIDDFAIEALKRTGLPSALYPKVHIKNGKSSDDFIKLGQQYNLPPARCIVVDNDVEVCEKALAAGMHAIHANENKPFTADGLLDRIGTIRRRTMKPARAKNPGRVHKSG